MRTQHLELIKNNNNIKTFPTIRNGVRSEIYSVCNISRNRFVAHDSSFFLAVQSVKYCFPALKERVFFGGLFFFFFALASQRAIPKSPKVCRVCDPGRTCPAARR